MSDVNDTTRDTSGTDLRYLRLLSREFPTA